jgi:hypothetical protein
MKIFNKVIRHQYPQGVKCLQTTFVLQEVENEDGEPTGTATLSTQVVVQNPSAPLEELQAGIEAARQYIHDLAQKEGLEVING